MHTIWYTRCPVATASGIAYQRGMFDTEFAESGYEVRNIKELGRGQATTHFTHVLADSVREGGAIPPLWARQQGADTVLVGLTWVAETLCFYVREDSDIRSMRDLRGRRILMPVRDYVEIDSQRGNAHKAWLHALEAHGMTADDVRFVRVPMSDDLLSIANVDYGKGRERVIPSIYAPEVETMLAGEVDAVFAKNAETKYLERCYAGRIRKIYDLLDSDRVEWKLNSNPRLIIASGNLAREHPEGLVRYLQLLVRAAGWASAHPGQAAEAMAGELGVEAADIAPSYEPGFERRLRPSLSAEHQRLLGFQMRFLVEHRYLTADVPLQGWMRPELPARGLRAREAGVGGVGKAPHAAPPAHLRPRSSAAPGSAVTRMTEGGTHSRLAESRRRARAGHSCRAGAAWSSDLFARRCRSAKSPFSTSE